MASRQHDLMWYRAGADLVVSRPSAIHRLHRGWRLSHLAVAPDHLGAHPAVARGSASSLGPSCRRGQMPQRCPRSIMTMIRMHTCTQNRPNARGLPPGATFATSRSADDDAAYQTAYQSARTVAVNDGPDDRSPASAPVHHTGRLSMAWKRSGVRVPLGSTR
jgi:hypothetical protein